MGLKAVTEKKIENAKVTHVRKNDRVVILTGRDRGKTSRVIDVNKRLGKVMVEGIAMVKHHERPNPARGVQGGIIEKEAYIDASNVQLVCPNCGKPTRVAHQTQSDGTKTRACKKCGSAIGKR